MYYRLNYTKQEIAEAGDHFSFEIKDLKFQIDKLIDSNRECFKFSVVFCKNKWPIPSVIRTFILDTSKDNMVWDQLLPVLYTPT